MDEKRVNRNSPWEKMSFALNSMKTWKAILAVQTSIICQESSQAAQWHGCSPWRKVYIEWILNANSVTSTQLKSSVTEKDSSEVGWINELRYRSTLTGKDSQHIFSEILNNRSCLYFSCSGSNRELVSLMCLRCQEWHVTQRPAAVSKAPSYTAKHWKHVWTARFTGNVVHFFFRLHIHLHFSTKNTEGLLKT